MGAPPAIRRGVSWHIILIYYLLFSINYSRYRVVEYGIKKIQSIVWRNDAEPKYITLIIPYTCSNLEAEFTWFFCMYHFGLSHVSPYRSWQRDGSLKICEQTNEQISISVCIAWALRMCELSSTNVRNSKQSWHFSFWQSNTRSHSHTHSPSLTVYSLDKVTTTDSLTPSRRLKCFGEFDVWVTDTTILRTHTQTSLYVFVYMLDRSVQNSIRQLETMWEKDKSLIFFFRFCILK